MNASSSQDMYLLNTAATSSKGSLIIPQYRVDLRADPIRKPCGCKVKPLEFVIIFNNLILIFFAIFSENSDIFPFAGKDEKARTSLNTIIWLAARKPRPIPRIWLANYSLSSSGRQSFRFEGFLHIFLREYV